MPNRVPSSPSSGSGQGRGQGSTVPSRPRSTQVSQEQACPTSISEFFAELNRALSSLKQSDPLALRASGVQDLKKLSEAFKNNQKLGMSCFFQIGQLLKRKMAEQVGWVSGSKAPHRLGLTVRRAFVCQLYHHLSETYLASKKTWLDIEKTQFETQTLRLEGVASEDSARRACQSVMQGKLKELYGWKDNSCCSIELKKRLNQLFKGIEKAPQNVDNDMAKNMGLAHAGAYAIETKVESFYAEYQHQLSKASQRELAVGRGEGAPASYASGASAQLQPLVIPQKTKQINAYVRNKLALLIELYHSINAQYPDHWYSRVPDGVKRIRSVLNQFFADVHIPNCLTAKSSQELQEWYASRPFRVEYCVEQVFEIIKSKHQQQESILGGWVTNENPGNCRLGLFSVRAASTVKFYEEWYEKLKPISLPARPIGFGYS